MNTGLIYTITNKANGKKYVGQTINKPKRWKAHVAAAYFSPQAVYRAMRKYGVDNFIFEVIAECPPEFLNHLEILYILLLDSHVSRNGYNMAWGGTDTAGEKNPFFGKKHSKESLKKMSEANIGREAWNKGLSPSEETKAKIAQKLMGNVPNNKGTFHTEETKAVMKAKRALQVFPPESQAKRAESLRGQKRTAEQKRNISEACKGRKNSDEHKQACRDAVKALWADPVYRERMLQSRRDKLVLRKAA